MRNIIITKENCNDSFMNRNYTLLLTFEDCNNITTYVWAKNDT